MATALTENDWWRTCLTTHTSAHEARAYLAATGQTAAVVTFNGQPVGVVTAEALNHWTHGDSPVRAVMDYATVPVHADADADETHRAFAAAARDWLKQRKGLS